MEHVLQKIRVVMLHMTLYFPQCLLFLNNSWLRIDHKSFGDCKTANFEPWKSRQMQNSKCILCERTLPNMTVNPTVLNLIKLKIRKNYNDQIVFFSHIHLCFISPKTWHLYVIWNTRIDGISWKWYVSKFAT